MVDVVFLLIIFFLTTSSLVELTRERVDLPVEEGHEQNEDRAGTIVINVTQVGRIVVEGERLTIEQLRAKLAHDLARSDEPADILVRADEAASLAVVNQIASHVADLGARSFRLATQTPSGGGR